MYRSRLITPSTLSMVLTGELFLVSLLSFIAFFADRFRLPLLIVFLALRSRSPHGLERLITFSGVNLSGRTN